MKELLIPKRIHFTWFSGDEYPEKIQECMNSWKKVLPDYELKLWNIDMARALNIPYVNEALDSKKWAFASDVVRAFAVWSEGGIYMDTDIQVLKKFDCLLDYSLTFFMEINDAEFKKNKQQNILDTNGYCIYPNQYIRGRQIQAAMFMGEKGNPILKEIIDFYKTKHFLDADGNPCIDVISPFIYAKIIEKHGFRYTDEEQFFSNLRVLRSEYVAASIYECTNQSIAIHLAAHSWNKRNVWKEIKYKIRTGPFYKLIVPFRKKFLS